MSSSEAAEDLQASASATAQINTALSSHGLLKRPLDSLSLSARDARTLTDAILSLLEQHQRDIELKQGLVASNQSLASQVERVQRFHKEEEEKRIAVERKLEVVRAQQSAQQQDANRTGAQLRKTTEELHRTRRQLVEKLGDIEKLQEAVTRASVKMQSSVEPSEKARSINVMPRRNTARQEAPSTKLQAVEFDENSASPSDVDASSPRTSILRSAVQRGKHLRDEDDGIVGTHAPKKASHRAVLMPLAPRNGTSNDVGTVQDSMCTISRPASGQRRTVSGNGEFIPANDGGGNSLRHVTMRKRRMAI